MAQVRFSLEEMKLFLFYSSGVESNRGVQFHHSTKEFGGMWGTQCLNPRFPLSTMPDNKAKTIYFDNIQYLSNINKTKQGPNLTFLIWHFIIAIN